jgi:hypothetical protein
MVSDLAIVNAEITNVCVWITVSTAADGECIGTFGHGVASSIGRQEKVSHANAGLSSWGLFKKGGVVAFASVASGIVDNVIESG